MTRDYENANIIYCVQVENVDCVCLPEELQFQERTQSYMFFQWKEHLVRANDNPVERPRQEKPWALTVTDLQMVDLLPDLLFLSYPTAEKKNHSNSNVN